MTLNLSGPISLGGATTGQSVNLELGQSATAQISFNDANVRTLTATSAGTALVMPTNFYGKSAGAVVDFTDQYVVSSNSSPATAAYRVNTNGFDYEGIQGTFSILSQWVTPASAGGNYEVFATATSGAVSTGTVGSWVATSGNPTWTRSAGIVGGGAQIVVLAMQVRAVGSGTVLDTWTVTLEAERF